MLLVAGLLALDVAKACNPDVSRIEYPTADGGFMTGPEVTLATPADRARVVDTVVAAFANDPAYRYFFDASCLREQSEMYAGYLFDRRITQGRIWIVEGGLSVSMWDSPDVDAGASKPDLPDEVLGRIAKFDGAVHPLFPSTPHWYLGNVATHPSYAGHRWGRKAIAAGLGEAEKAGLPAYLETATARNVGMYQRAGWSLVGETEDPIPAWVMRR
ncbi:GNAT family N-acetyltransferase [Nocardia sp. NPDC058666]|uniref:GNAT family N-acetyltransferase n=1 Tax=Nocardia sp. NPDC058666 TaxID=3346587 RepID=UPI0036612E58